MRFFVLGATGATGGLFIEQALADGHDVTAYVRSPAKVTPRERLTVVAGDVRDADALAEAMHGTDAVISTLGLGRARKPDNLIADSTRAIVEAAKHSGISRVLIMSAFGVGESLRKASALARLMYSSGGKAVFADKAAGERYLTSSDLDWTLAYPVLLTNKPKSGKYLAIDLAELTRLPGMPRVSRADVAAFLLSAAKDGEWFRRTAVLLADRHDIT
ncbi:NAD(P)H-binding protein [Pseudofrankia sp. BMG5.37]|uniref:NAD(P)-dependent oxidoreductase n=1 Tax=Pseudofrankia sp. BMG5.37 TaxID=3050035 RepID=UPI002895D788|nr:NAD(P)H-binding protein [Pseudofrankia sp. BMG5.37]MDT3439242.1 NAD(P)H-binding protein [Pseudofrankia sp. BMG5.37]